ncbi:EF-hand domain-containing protein [Brevundimonas sp. VNH65]|uniref:EF-hand domain-containing protein n=1 Tax=Brevundimonas sp. VNH65 TaxID=3400917 RepID=UPI003BFE7909
MAVARPPKKSETLEVRLSHAEKADFMARCRDEGLTASEAVRGLIAGRTARPGRRKGLGWTVAAALGAGLAVGAIAAPSLAQSGDRAVSVADDRAAFHQMDRDGDGVISWAEFRGR